MSGFLTGLENPLPVITTEVGMPRKLAGRVQVGGPLLVLRSYSKIVAEYEFSSEVGNSLIVREPAGVVGAITPWNYPLLRGSLRLWLARTDAFSSGFLLGRYQDAS